MFYYGLSDASCITQDCDVTPITRTEGMPLFITPHQTKVDRLIAAFAQKDTPSTADFLALQSWELV